MTKARPAAKEGEKREKEAMKVERKGESAMMNREDSFEWDKDVF